MAHVIGRRLAFRRVDKASAAYSSLAGSHPILNSQTPACLLAPLYLTCRVRLRDRFMLLLRHFAVAIALPDLSMIQTPVRNKASIAALCACPNLCVASPLQRIQLRSSSHYLRRPIKRIDPTFNSFRPLTSKMPDPKEGKQATLGYVKASQLTLGCDLQDYILNLLCFSVSFQRTYLPIQEVFWVKFRRTQKANNP